MKTVEIVSKLGDKRAKDGKAHAGKRKVSLPENQGEIGAWAKQAAEESKVHGLEFGLLDILERGYRLLHQGDMNRKLTAKFGSEQAKTAKVQDLTGVDAI